MVAAKPDLIQAAHCAIIENAFAEEKHDTGKRVCDAAVLLQQNGVAVFDDVLTCAQEINNKRWHEARAASQRVAKTLRRATQIINDGQNLDNAAETLSRLPEMVKQRTPGFLAALHPKEDTPPYL